MKEKKETIRPEVIDDKKPESESRIVPDDNKELQPKTPIAKTLSSFSTWSFYNKLREKGLESWRRVIKAETNLFHSLIDHTRALRRLNDIDTEIEIERLERDNKLRAAQRKEKLADKKDEIADLEAQKRLAELKKEIREIKKPINKKEDKLDKRLPKDAEREAIREKWRIKTEIGKIAAGYEEKQLAIKRYNLKIEEVAENPDLGDKEKEEQIQEIERLIIEIQQGI